MPLLQLTPALLADSVMQARSQVHLGTLPSRIEQLASAQADWFAVQVQAVSGATWARGDVGLRFALMSVIKPWLLLYILERYGATTVWQVVGTTPSEQPFNSLVQLQIDGGVPRNPMINSGAIALCDRIPGPTGRDRCAALCDWLNTQAGTHLSLDQAMLASVRTMGQDQNQKLAAALARQGHLQTPDVTLDTYQQICCLAGTVVDLVQLGLLLAAPTAAIAPAHRRITTALMLTCGLYEASPRWAVDVGLPTKSGVSGAVVATLPGAGAIAVYSPPLDAIGNSAVGLALLRNLAQTLNLSLFSA